MPSPSTIIGDLNVIGNLSPQTMAYPVGSVKNADVNSLAQIDVTKMNHRYSLTLELFAAAVAVTALTKIVHTVKALTGAVTAVQAAVVTQATGADRTVNVDVKKSTAGGAFATVLTSTVAIINTTANLTVVAGVVNATPAALIAGDILEFVVTVAGAAGNQALGLVATLTLWEAAV